MAYTYAWEIKNLRKVSTNDINNAIIGTQWKVTATNADGITGQFDGATPFDLHTIDTGSFTPFDELTEEKVLGWIKDVVSGSASTSYWMHINQQITKQISEKTNVITEVGTYDLPWSTGSLSDIIPPAPVVE
jgi:hypothetical protein